MPSNGTAATILLVDDDEYVRRFVRRILVDHGYQIIEATNGAEALAGCGKTPISSAICNSHYVELNGEAINSSWHQAKCV